MKNEVEILEMYQAGVPVHSICAELGVQGTSIYATLRKHGVPLRTQMRAEGVKHVLSIGSTVPAPEPDNDYKPYRRPVYGQEVVDAVLLMKEKQGRSGLAISKLLGIKYTHVLKILHDARVQLVPGRSSGAWSHVREGIRRDLVELNVPVEEVMIKYGIGAGALKSIIDTDLRLKPAEFQRPQFYETVINEVLMRLQNELGVTLSPGKDGAVQMRLF